MKKVSRTVAMVLVLVMLAGSFNFTSCISIATGNDDFMVWEGILYILIIGLIGTAIIGNLEAQPDDTQIYLAGYDNTISTEHFSFMSRIYSMPEAASAMQNIGLLPETERNVLAGRMNSLSEERRVSLFRTLNSLPDAEIISSMERINAFSEEGLISMVRSFNSLSEDAFNSLIEELKSKAELENIVLIDISQEVAYIKFLL
jgi:hypothetical protein